MSADLSNCISMVSLALQRSPVPLQRLSTFKDKPTTTSTTPSHPASTTTSTSPLETFASNTIFSAFLSPHFDSARFSSQALSFGSTAASVEKLQEGIHLLEKQLRSEVLSRHYDLLAQLSSLKGAESALSVIRSGVSTLQSSVNRVRSEIAEPNRQIRFKTIQLANIHKTVELLQFSIRILRPSKKLGDMMATDGVDPKKAER